MRCAPHGSDPQVIETGLWCFYRRWVWVCLTVCLCLAFPDAKVNNQSETTKCAMESGDGNTGEWPPAFFLFASSLTGQKSGCSEFYCLVQQVSNSQPKWKWFTTVSPPSVLKKTTLQLSKSPCLRQMKSFPSLVPFWITHSFAASASVTH